MYLYSLKAYRNSYADCTKEEFLGMYREEGCEAARMGYGLEHLVYHKDRRVRETVAKQGYGLDILVHDEDFLVRLAVAEQGYGLDILKNDKNGAVAHDAKKRLGIFSFSDLCDNFFRKYYVEIDGKHFNLITCYSRPIEFFYYDRYNDNMHSLQITVDENDLACAEGTKQEDFDNSLLNVLQSIQDKTVVIKARS